MWWRASTLSSVAHPSKSMSIIPQSWMSPCHSCRAHLAQCRGHSKVTLPPLRMTILAERQKRFNSSLDFACCSSSHSAKEAPYWCKFNDCHWLQGPHGSDPHKSTPAFDSIILMRIPMVASCSTFMWVSVHLTTLPTLPIMESREVQNSISIPCPVKPAWWGSGTPTSAGACLKSRASREMLEASELYS